ncbi:MAG TPA: hypothetical protein VJR48_08550 [Ktedonobacterales bacterium]|nr:hypothetical protein [Ktedonobacterales bacterium]
MTGSAADHDEQHTLETVPLELLPVHQGLEEDGSSWRATLPLAENLLRRVAAFPIPSSACLASDSRPGSAASAPPAPHLRPRHRHTRH